MPPGGPAEAAQRFLEERSRERVRGEPRSDYAGLFPLLELEDIYATIRHLCYVPGMGGGFGFSRADVLRMSLGEAESHLEWLEAQRERERPKRK